MAPAAEATTLAEDMMHDLGDRYSELVASAHRLRHLLQSFPTEGCLCGSKHCDTHRLGHKKSMTYMLDVTLPSHIAERDRLKENLIPDVDLVSDDGMIGHSSNALLRIGRGVLHLQRDLNQHQLVLEEALFTFMACALAAEAKKAK